MTDPLAPDKSVKSEPLDGHTPSQAKNGLLPAKSPKARGTRPPARKTIKAFGSSALRTAQACDRCRAKKSRCDGKQPTCSSCAAAGMECVVSDRLTRKSYPKGYTELLEQQSRQLLAENARLKGALDRRDEQLASYAEKSGESGTKSEFPGARDSFLFSRSTSPERQDPGSSQTKFHESHTAHENGCICCQGSPAVHERPVSVAGGGDGDDGSVQENIYSDFDDDYDEDGGFDLASTVSGYSYTGSDDYGVGYYNQQIRPAPGAFAAATAIEQMHNKRRHTGTNIGDSASNKNGNTPAESTEQMLTALVAAAVPRSTEETLYVPTLLARVGKAYGYNSAAAKITAGAFASLKESSGAAIRHSAQDSVAQIMARAPVSSPNTAAGEDSEIHAFLQSLGLPPRAQLDSFMATFFEQWGRVVPIVNKTAYSRQYARFCDMLDGRGHSPTQSQSQAQMQMQTQTQRPQEAGDVSHAQLGAITVCAVALAMLSNKSEYAKTENCSPEASAEQARYVARLSQYDALIHAFARPSCTLTQACSLASLRIVALAFHYFLAIGDHAACHEVRGRAVTMAQQLRLHRCPAAVLGLGRERNDRTFQAFMQGERRVVFWCVYVLDVYASLSLGVPRLLKDYEIECATPFSGSADDDADGAPDENILVVNNTRLTIFGKVARIALCVMQFCKVLGNITDSIFSRSGNFSVHEREVEKDQILDCWRRDLPAEFKFEVDVNGVDLEGKDRDEHRGASHAHRRLLVFLYYHAKALIYLPVISKYGNHHNVGLSTKEQLALGHNDVSMTVASMSSIQQSAVQILQLLKSLATSAPYVLPLPMNIPREHSRFALLVAIGALDYIKGGPLQMQSKQLLLDTIPLLKQESVLEIPSSLTKKSSSLLEYAILSILGLNLGRTAGSSGANTLRRRIINNESLAKVGGLQKQGDFGNSSFEMDSAFDVPMMVNLPQSQGANEFTGQQQIILNGNGNGGSIELDRNAAFTRARSSAPNADLYSHAVDMDPNMARQSFSPYASQAPTQIKQEFTDNGNFDSDNPLFDESSDFFKFDELIKNFGNDMSGGEFVTDGSLGLAPFLNEPNEYNQGHIQNDNPFATEF